LIDVEQTHRIAAGTTELVQQIAGHVRVIADQAGCAHCGFTDLAAAADALAAQARTSLKAIDCCVAQGLQCRDTGALNELGDSQLDLATTWIGLLERTLDAVVRIYGEACSRLADRAAVVEEHLTHAPDCAGQRLSAGLLGQHARALAHGTATRHAI
jgi:hypothetical protein